MSSLPVLTVKECEKLLLENGFILDRQKGSHKIYYKNGFRMVLPFHSGKTLHPKIIKQVIEIIQKSKG